LIDVPAKQAWKRFITEVTTPKAERPAGSLPSSKPPPARHRSGDRSARRGDVFFIVTQTSSRKETHHVVLFLAAKLESFCARGAAAQTNIPS
jgi:hypothetical protein